MGASWLVLIADDDPDIHIGIRDALANTVFLGRPVELLSATSAEEMEKTAALVDPARFAVAIVGMKNQSAATDLVGKLREQFGSPLQVVLRSDAMFESLAQRFEISAFLAKQEISPERLRALMTLSIRNFRLLIAMRVLCENLNDFVMLSARAETTQGLDELLKQILQQNAAVWQFDYLLIPDLAAVDETALEGAWHPSVVQRLRALAGDRQSPVGLTLMSREDTREIWGCVVQPLGGRVQTGLALSQAERPNDILLRDVRVLLRSWALTRESVELQQLAKQQRAIRDEMLRDRRESIARIVADVAHDVSTPLGVANTAAGMVASVLSNEHFQALRADASLKDDIEDVYDAAGLVQRNLDRARELVGNFHRLSVGQIVDRWEELDLLRTVQEIVSLWGPEARRNKVVVNVHDELAPECRTWLGYLGHLSQVLLNLFVNATRYAYPDKSGGTIDVHLRSRMVDDRPEFVVEVRDKGVGIPKENLPQIFDPFFTTGHARGGTGLGLAILHNLVTAIFGGTIRCESEVGQGTTFIMQFSHCAEQNPTESAKGPAKNDQAELDALEEFIELQRKVAVRELLTSHERRRLAAVRASVEPYLLAHQGGGDRRGAVRVAIRRKASVSVGDEAATAEVRDISLSGAMLLYHRHVEPGSRVGIQYFEGLTVHGEAVSCTAMPPRDAAEAQWQLGVRFAALGDEERRGLEALVAQLLLEGLGVELQSGPDSLR